MISQPGAPWSATRVLCAVTVFLILVGESSAQEKREPPPRKLGISPDTASQAPTAKLPSIDLPEFVITGKETIDLPRFSKRSTEPQTEEALLARNEVLGKRDDVQCAESGASREAGFLPGADIMDGRVNIGYGSHRTPSFEGWFGQTYGVSGFLMKASYVSSDGHLPHADYREGHTSLSGSTTIPGGIDLIGGARVEGSLGLDGHTYRLYGSVNPVLERTVGRFACGGSIQAITADLFEYGIRASVRTASQVDLTSARETTLGLELNGSRSLHGVDLRGDVGLWTGSYSTSVPVVNPYFLEFGLSARRQFSDVWDVAAGVVLYAYRGSDTKSAVRFYPRVRALMHATPSVTFFMTFEARVARSGLSAMIQENPYLANTASIRHQDHSIDASLGAEVSVGPGVRTRVALSVERIHNLPLYVDPSRTGIWNVDYLGVTEIASFGGELYADITDRDHLAGSITAKSVRNSSTNRTVPYVPAAEITGLYQRRFPAGVMLGVTMRVVGQRFVDLQGSRYLSPFTVIDVRGEYVVVRNLTATVMVNNVFNKAQTWWDQYEGVGRTFSFGIAFTW